MKLKKIHSLSELRQLAFSDENYKKLALAAADNLGGNSRGDLNRAMQWLNTNADETDEQGVIDEVNFCRDLV